MVVHRLEAMTGKGAREGSRKWINGQCTCCGQAGFMMERTVVDAQTEEPIAGALLLPRGYREASIVPVEVARRLQG